MFIRTQAAAADSDGGRRDEISQENPKKWNNSRQNWFHKTHGRLFCFTKEIKEMGQKQWNRLSRGSVLLDEQRVSPLVSQRTSASLVFSLSLKGFIPLNVWCATETESLMYLLCLSVYCLFPVGL